MKLDGGGWRKSSIMETFCQMDSKCPEMDTGEMEQSDVKAS